MTNYWPFYQNMNDQAGTAHFYNCIKARLAEDRLNNPRSAIFFDTGSCQVKPDVYFNSNLTILTWIKVLKSQLGHPMFDFNNGLNTNQVFFSLSDGTTSRPYFQIYNSQNEQTDTTASKYVINIGEWTHVAVVFNTSKVFIYVNGKNSDFINSVYNYSTVNAPGNVVRNKCFFGHSEWESHGVPNATAYFDEIKFYNRSLSLLEILDDFY